MHDLFHPVFSPCLVEEGEGMSELGGCLAAGKANPPQLLTGSTAMTALYAGTSKIDSEFPRANVRHQNLPCCKSAGRQICSMVCFCDPPSRVFPDLTLPFLFMLRDLWLASYTV